MFFFFIAVTHTHTHTEGEGEREREKLKQFVELWCCTEELHKIDYAKLYVYNGSAFKCSDFKC